MTEPQPTGWTKGDPACAGHYEVAQVVSAEYEHDDWSVWRDPKFWDGSKWREVEGGAEVNPLFVLWTHFRGLAQKP